MVIRKYHVPSWSDFFLHNPFVFLRVGLPVYERWQDIWVEHNQRLLLHLAVLVNEDVELVYQFIVQHQRLLLWCCLFQQTLEFTLINLLIYKVLPLFVWDVVEAERKVLRPPLSWLGSGFQTPKAVLLWGEVLSPFRLGTFRCQGPLRDQGLYLLSQILVLLLKLSDPAIFRGPLFTQLGDLIFKLEVPLLHLLWVGSEWHAAKWPFVGISGAFVLAGLRFFFICPLGVSRPVVTSILEAPPAGWFYTGVGWQPLEANVVELVLPLPIFAQSAVDLALLVSLVLPCFGWRGLAIHYGALIDVAPVDLLNWLCLVYISEVAVDVFHWEPPAILQAEEAQILLLFLGRSPRAHGTLRNLGTYWDLRSLCLFYPRPLPAFHGPLCVCLYKIKL